jgi:ABC-type branched-subunit amino acid transport system substrate-binding protein
VVRRSWLRLVCVLLLAALVGAACGSDREDDPNAGADTGTEEGSGSEQASGEPASFGDLESPCGDGEGGEAGEQGVGDGAITIGYGDDAGFPNSPGLNHEMSDAVEALIDWCNEQGGINGWEIKGNYYDAKILDVNNAMQKACSEVFMVVGQGWSLDSQQEETRVGCDLPSVPAFSVSPSFAHGPKMIQGVPNPVDFTPAHVADAMAKQFPDEVKKAATMVANYAATLDTRAKVKSAYPSFGWEFIDGCDVEYNIGGESDWKPFAQRLKECGAEIVYFAGSPFPNFQNFLEAANQIGLDAIFQVDANFYMEDFAKWNANGFADKVYLRFAFVPFEDRDSTKAVDDYMTLLEESGGDISLLGMQAASSFLLWAEGVKACGADVTRQCVLDAIAEITDWTAGGLHAPTNPGTNMPPDCGALLKLEGTEYVRVTPEEPGEFECDDSYVAEVTGPIVEQAKLNEDRISTLFTAG